jgi:hypothetical protein
MVIFDDVDNGLTMITRCIFSISKLRNQYISIGEPAKATSFPIYTSEEFNFSNYTLSALDSQ